MYACVYACVHVWQTRITNRNRTSARPHMHTRMFAAYCVCEHPMPGAPCLAAWGLAVCNGVGTAVVDRALWALTAPPTLKLPTATQ